MCVWMSQDTRDTLTGLGCRGGDCHLLAEQVEPSGFQTHFRMLERQLELQPEGTEQQPTVPPRLVFKRVFFYITIYFFFFLKAFGSPSKTRSVPRDTGSELVSGCCWGDVTSIPQRKPQLDNGFVLRCKSSGKKNNLSGV